MGVLGTGDIWSIMDHNSWTDGLLEERKIFAEPSWLGEPAEKNDIKGCHIGFGAND